MVAKIQPKIPASETKISRFVSKQLPAVFSEMDSLLIPFLEAYYEFMEEEGGATLDIKSLPDYIDHRKAPEQFLKFFMEDFMPGIPADVKADKRLLIQYAKQFYRSRGSEPSFKFLFRILFNEDVEIYYPKVDIFRTSDAKWVVRNVIKLTAFDEQIESLANRKIYGVESAATALVESVSIQYVGAEKIAYVVISNRYGQFQIDEAITTTAESDEIPLIYARILGSVASANIVSKGTGYTAGTTIPITNNGDGSGVFAIIDTVDIDGGILKVRIVDGGIDYVTVPPTADLSTLSGTGGEITFSIAGNFTEAGYFVDDSCMLSSTKKLQDGRMYQEYSYVLKSKVPLAKFRDVVKRLVHPAGMYMSAELISGQSSETEIEAVRVLFHATQPDGINAIDPDDGKPLFVDTQIRMGSSPTPRTIAQLDALYPDGLPGGVSLFRLFEPESNRVLSTLDESYMSITTVTPPDGYVDDGYVDTGYTE